MDGDDQPVVRLEALDGAIVAAGGRVEAGSERLHSLMMEAVDRDRRLSGRLAELRGRVDHHAVGKVGPSDGSGVVVFEVLDQRSAERDVDQLLTAADPEDR